LAAGKRSGEKKQGNLLIGKTSDTCESCKINKKIDGGW